MPHKQAANPLFRTDDARWQALLTKDHRGDGAFWFAVKTTGIYCRPSCPARLPKRENVVFYNAIEEAERAGFRACQRCDPKGPGLAARQTDAIATACRLIEQSEELPSLGQLARAVAMSPSHFHRLFKATTGLTPKAYSLGQRARRVKLALPKNSTVTNAIYEAGYNSNSRFYTDATKMLGMKPSAFRDGGRDNLIRFGIGKCSLGSLLVAVSATGVCAIFLGDNPDQLASNLQARFPKAKILAGDAGFEKLVTHVARFVDAPNRGLALPLDIRGTIFQQRVWQELQKIPLGKTIPYAELAQRLGSPQSTRAVAQACGANPLAIAIPCHRVVRSDGGISGYRWGIARKKQLLAWEKSHV